MNRFAYILICLMLAAPASSQTEDQSKLEDLTRQQAAEQEKAEKLIAAETEIRNEISSLQSQLVAIGREIDKLEIAGQGIGTRLKDLETREAILENRIYEDRKSLARLLGALQRIENNPPPALAVSPEDAANAARAAQLMTSLSQNLNLRAKRLGNQLKELTGIRDDIGFEIDNNLQNQMELTQQRDRLRSVIDQKSKLESSIAQDRQQAQARVKSLADEAETLRELIRALEQTAASIRPRIKPDVSQPIASTEVVPRIKPKDTAPLPPISLPPDTMRFADARGRLMAPVRGQIRRSYSGESKGLTVATQSGSQVVAPYAGRVEFAGPFKNYEKVVIINVGEGYFLLMTGLGDLYTESGSMVAIGEPVGLMPFNAQNDAELYIEIRKNGSPVNPAPWLGTAFARQG